MNGASLGYFLLKNGVDIEIYEKLPFNEWCRYHHKPAVLRTEHIEYLQKIDKTLYKYVKSHSKPVNVLKVLPNDNNCRNKRKSQFLRLFIMKRELGC